MPPNASVDHAPAASLDGPMDRSVSMGKEAYFGINRVLELNKESIITYVYFYN